MATVNDVHVELVRIQKEIQEHLGLEDNALVFEYLQNDGKIRLDLITVNPRHNQSFLFHQVEGFDKVDAITRMRDYVVGAKEKESHYTVQWQAKNDTELHTSYFRASSVYDALDKLYYGRDMHTITVFSVTLNPVA